LGEALLPVPQVVLFQDWELQVEVSQARLEQEHAAELVLKPEATSVPVTELSPDPVTVDGEKPEAVASDSVEYVVQERILTLPYEQVTPEGQQPRKQRGVCGW